MNERMAMLEMMIEELRGDVGVLRARLDALDQRARAVQEAERRWFPLLRQRHTLVFANEAGDITKIPAALARLLAEERSFDGSVRDGGTHLDFVREGKVIARVKKTLVRQLCGLLAHADLEAMTLPATSPAPRREPVPVPDSQAATPASVGRDRRTNSEDPRP